VNAILEFLKNRLKEYSTWLGILMVAGSFGLKLTPEQQQAIIYFGMALAAAPDGSLAKALAREKPVTERSEELVKAVKTIKEVASEDTHKAINDLLDSDSK
jgi:hypothetical protein